MISNVSRWRWLPWYITGLTWIAKQRCWRTTQLTITFHGLKHLTYMAPCTENPTIMTVNTIVSEYRLWYFADSSQWWTLFFWLFLWSFVGKSFMHNIYEHCPTSSYVHRLCEGISPTCDLFPLNFVGKDDLHTSDSKQTCQQSLENINTISRPWADLECLI